MKRDILNYLGEKIGEMESPQGVTWTDAEWDERLSVFSRAPVVKIPDVTPRQIKQALVLSGISMQQVSDGLDTLPEPQKSLAHIEWEYSLTFKRDNPLVAKVAQMLGWTSQQLDQLWLFAGSL